MFKLFNIFLCAFLLAGCGLSNPTPVVAKAVSKGDSAVNFSAAQAVLISRCANCHEHAAWARYDSSDYVSTGEVVLQSPNSSRLLQRIAGNKTGSNLPADMPQGGPALSASELETIITWINSSPTPSTSPSASLINAASRTAKALAVIKTNCAACHGTTQTAGGSSPYPGAVIPAFTGSAFQTDAAFIQAGLVALGNAQSSWLYQSLKGAGKLNIMPPVGPALSSADALAISDWIGLLGQP